MFANLFAPFEHAQTSLGGTTMLNVRAGKEVAMCFRRVVSILLSATFAAWCLVSPCAQEPDRKAAPAREIFRQARKSMGEDAALNAVRSISATGTWRDALQEEIATGEIKIDLLLPDRYMKTTTLSAKQMPRITRIETVEGDKAWTDSKIAQDSTMLGAGPLGGRSAGGQGSRGSGGRSGGEAPAPGIIAESDNPEYQKQILADFSSLLTLWLLPDSISSSLERDSTVAWTANEAMYDTLKFKGANDLEFHLMIDKKTHHVVVLSYRGFVPGVAADRPVHRRAGEERPVLQGYGMVEIEISVSDYRAVSEKGIGTIWLPHRITKIADGRTVEDITIKTFKLNPDLKVKQFERKRKAG
jgi:hypothetical protein